MITSPEFFLVSSFAVLLMNIGADSVSYEQFGQTHKIEGVDTIVVAMGSASAGQLGEELKDFGKPVHVIGDAGNIGKIVNAIADGLGLERRELLTEEQTIVALGEDGRQ